MAVVFALLAAWAWAKSAMLQLGKPGDRRDVSRFFGNAIIEKTGASPACPMAYLSPVRFLPSTITLLNIRLIRVW
jgi:hypothetical protein